MRRASLLLLFTACQGGIVASESEGGTSTSTSTSASPTTSAASFATSTTGAGTGGGTSGAGSTGAGEEATGAPPTTDTGDPTGEPPPLHTLHFAVIGDYGLDGTATGQVAGRVASWNPEIVLTTGDNNYYSGLAKTIDANIGKYYRGFIAPYVGTYGPGAAENRFFPCPGNHDWNSGTLEPYLDYFTLPGNERYYAVRRGPVEFFMLDSDYHEPDGLTPTQVQGQWLEAALAESTASFQVVVMHHAPYSSGYHGGTKAMRWPYAAWGADLVLAGHDHNYERFVVDGLDYVVTGTGGAALRKFVTEEPGSQRGHANGFGALRGEANEERMTLDFIGVNGGRIDRLTIAADPPKLWQVRVAANATWRWRETPPGAGWDEPDFADDDWAAGPAPLGFGAGGEA
ncbi:MAG TPA: metallophosphoesterase, partial [Nannocystis sp.]